MNVPSLPGQQVQAAAIPAAYQQEADTGGAAILGAVGDGVSEIGHGIAVLEARQDQIALFNYSADARAKSDELSAEYDAMDGPAALARGPKIVPEYRAWADERASNLSPRQRELARQYSEGLALGMRDHSNRRMLDVTQKMANDALANVVQTNTYSASQAAFRGGVRMKQGVSAVQAGGITVPGWSGGLDEGALNERWNAISTAIDGYAETHADGLPTDQETFKRTAKEQARSDFVLGVTRGLLAREDTDTAKAYFDAHEAEVLAPNERATMSSHLDSAGERADVERRFADIVDQTFDSGEGSPLEKRKAALALVEKAPADLRPALRQNVEAEATRRDDFDFQTRSEAFAALITRVKKREPINTILADQLAEVIDDGQTASLLTLDRNLGSNHTVMTELPLYGRLSVLAANPDRVDAFLKEPVLQYVADARMTDEDGRVFLAAQAQAAAGFGKNGRTADGAAFKATQTGYTIGARVTQAVKELGITDAAEEGQFRRSTSQAIARAQTPDKPELTEEEAQVIINTQTREVVLRRPEWFTNDVEKNVYELTMSDIRITDIPATLLPSLRQAMQLEGMTVSNETLRAKYLQLMQDGAPEVMGDG